MGLDVTAYEKLVRVDCSDPNGCKHVHLYAAQGFEDRMGSLRPGCYESRGIVHRFRAGSYGGYSVWRKRLSIIVLGVEPGEVWKDPDRFVGRPFVELINFSDCEGTLGPEVCAKLLADCAHAGEMAADELFEDWQRTFEIAGGQPATRLSNELDDGVGAVKFH